MEQNTSNRHLTESLIAANVAIFLFFAGPSLAGPGQILADSDLTPKDLETASAAAESLYTRQGVAPGDKMEWSNAASGSSGAVEVLDVNRSGSCVIFRHTTLSASGTQRRLDVQRCKNAEGKWFLTAQ